MEAHEGLDISFLHVYEEAKLLRFHDLAFYERFLKKLNSLWLSKDYLFNIRDIMELLLEKSLLNDGSLLLGDVVVTFFTPTQFLTVFYMEVKFEIMV